jgi:hypothetical protein
LLTGLDLGKQVLDPLDGNVLAQDGNLGVAVVHLPALFFLLQAALVFQVVVVSLAPVDPSPLGGPSV